MGVFVPALLAAAGSMVGSQVTKSFFPDPLQPQHLQAGLSMGQANRLREQQMAWDRSIPRVKGTASAYAPADIAFAQNPIMQAFLT